MTGSLCRVATLPEIEKVLDWAAEEGWNPGLDDAAAFHAADPEGFFIAEVAAQPVAAISVVNHSDDFSFLGLYLCLPEYRGQGIGYSLWTHALAHAGSRTVGLDGVPEQEANYARSGFSLVGRTRRLEGTFPVVTLSAHLATADDRDALANLDQRANGFARTTFLETWTAHRASRRTVLLTAGTDIAGSAT
ncbi:MAG: GNAT family N-acetyltransferase, partial [Rhodobacteraceae bacterium]|nr:GNAT family N-acetyltransferase [Paracoccaceae bacterium]